MYVRLASISAEAVGEGEFEKSAPLLFDANKNDLTIAFEGVYFPIDDFMQVFEGENSLASLNIQNDNLLLLSGKIDYIDLESWSLSRTVFANGVSKKSQASLNHVLDYSGN